MDFKYQMVKQGQKWIIQQFIPVRDRNFFDWKSWKNVFLTEDLTLAEMKLEQLESDYDDKYWEMEKKIKNYLKVNCQAK